MFMDRSPMYYHNERVFQDFILDAEKSEKLDINFARLGELIEKSLDLLSESELIELKLLLIEDCKQFSLEHAFKIYQNYKVIEDWKHQLSPLEDNREHSEKFGINIYEIMTHGRKNIGDWSNNSKNDPFIERILDYVVNIHFNHKLFLDTETVRILYDPINEGYENLYGTEAYGEEYIRDLGGLPYSLIDKLTKNGWHIISEEEDLFIDLKIPITLNLIDYEKDVQIFSFFFALRLSQVDIMDTTAFLDYQLSITFKSDFAKFKSFLLALCIKYKNITLDAFEEENKQILTTEIVDLVKDWIDTNTITLNNLKMELPTKQLNLLEKPKIDKHEINHSIIEFPKTELERFLNLFSCETNGSLDKIAFFHHDEVKKLSNWGLNSVFKGEYIVVNFNEKKKKGLFFYAFYLFYNAYEKEYNLTKDFISLYIQNTFDNFKSMPLNDIYKRLRGDNPPKHTFKIKGVYLPE